MKILILTSFQRAIDLNDAEYQKESSYALWEYLQTQGHEVLLTRYDELVFRLGKETAITLNGQDLSDFDVIIPRSPTLLEKYGIDNTDICQAIALYSRQKGSFVLNGEHLEMFPANFNKLFQMTFYALYGLPIPQTTFSLATENLSSLSFPVVRKPFTGSHGNSIQLITHSDQLTAEHGKSLLQEALPNKTDFRILVLHGECLGAMKRSAQGESFVSNFSAGGKVSAVELTSEMRQLSTQLAKLLHLDFCGVDLMSDEEGNLRILEVNRFPEFRGFMQATGVSVPKHINQTLLRLFQ